MPVFFIERDAIRNGTVSITGPLARHLRGSLRVRPGEMVWLGESDGPRYQVRITATDRDRLTGDILSESAPPPRNVPRLTLGLALINQDHMEWAIQKATELGVARLVPLLTARTVVRPKAGRADRLITRWQRIALEAAQQSMQWNIPTVMEPISFDTWCADPGQDACRWLLWEGPGRTLLRNRLRGQPRPNSMTLAIGPEGGFDASEVDLAERHGFEVVSLGDRILRTESAVLAALAIVQYEWENLG
ncbi:MAG TPA: RsmE family RNA methyltransferase [Nitrospirales bacterium]|nr:RsmE family RNA methyltransferase [Nitrospirales bacterium]